MKLLCEEARSTVTPSVPRNEFEELREWPTLWLGTKAPELTQIILHAGTPLSSACGSRKSLSKRTPHSRFYRKEPPAYRYIPIVLNQEQPSQEVEVRERSKLMCVKGQREKWLNNWEMDWRQEMGSAIQNHSGPGPRRNEQNSWYTSATLLTMRHSKGIKRPVIRNPSLCEDFPEGTWKSLSAFFPSSPASEAITVLGPGSLHPGGPSSVHSMVSLHRQCAVSEQCLLHA
jgi:hypothetical protein